MTHNYTPWTYKPAIYTALQFIEGGIGTHSHVDAYSELQRAFMLHNTVAQDPIYCALSLALAGYAREDTPGSHSTTVRLQDAPNVFAIVRWHRPGIVVGYVDANGKKHTGLCIDRVMAVTALRKIREMVKGQGKRRG